MKKFEKLLSFLLGMFFMAILIIAAPPTLASTTTRQISAVYNNIKIYVDDVLIQPKDAQGNKIEPFIYNGTTYLPVRAVSEALGKAVSWDGRTSSIFIGKHNSDIPSVMLSQLDYFSESGYWHEKSSPKDSLGNTYNEGFTGGEAKREYILNGKYRKLSGKYILFYDSRSSDTANGTLKIYGDDKLLYSYTGMKAGVMPVDFQVDLTGVLKLRIEMDNYYLWYAGYYDYATGIVDVGLYQ